MRPVLLHYPADRDKSVGTAMIVAPGGGFRTLMMSYEGVDIARRLNAMGVDAFVLKYRLVYSGPGAPTAPRPVRPKRRRTLPVDRLARQGRPAGPRALADTRGKPGRTWSRWRATTAGRPCD